MAAPVLILDETDSTNAEARRRAEAGEVGPLWIAARRQTAGRGRRGRQWGSDSGNLFTTLLLLTQKSPAEAAQLTFAASLAVADLLDRYVPSALVTIKWPNDVLIDGLKASGILVESGAHASGGLWVAVGCGLNLAHAPADTERPATSAADHLSGQHAGAPAPQAALAVLVEAFARRLAAWETYGFQVVADAWTRRAAGVGRPCIARLEAEILEGVAEGLDADGALKLRLPSGEVRRITAGDVFPSGA